MTKLDELKREIEAKLPGVKATEDAPSDSRGSWFLDLSLKDRAATVEWKPKKGFGVTSLPSDGFGEGPDEVYGDIGSTVKRLSELLLKGQRTQAPRELLLHELRTKLGISQEGKRSARERGQAPFSALVNRRQQPFRKKEPVPIPLPQPSDLNAYAGGIGQGIENSAADALEDGAEERHPDQYAEEDRRRHGRKARDQRPIPGGSDSARSVQGARGRPRGKN